MNFYVSDTHALLWYLINSKVGAALLRFLGHVTPESSAVAYTLLTPRIECLLVEIENLRILPFTNVYAALTL